jgi:DNA-binding NarL/FixJ family response regulator
MIVDDQALVRAGFAMLVRSQPDLVVVAECADGQQCLDTLSTVPVDVVLMDVRMPRMDGIEATRLIVERDCATRVLVLTTFDLDEYAFGALAAGASGFLLKDVQASELTAAIRAVHSGDATLSPRVTRRMLELFGGRLPNATGGDDAALATLTDRERDVFAAIGEGMTNNEIAAALFVSESTVKTHVGRVLAKMGARDRVQAVILAHRLGVTGV